MKTGQRTAEVALPEFRRPFGSRPADWPGAGTRRAPQPQLIYTRSRREAPQLQQGIHPHCAALSTQKEEEEEEEGEEKKKKKSPR